MAIRLNKTDKINALTNFLESISTNKNLFIYPDEINGKTFCVAEKLGSTKTIKSNFKAYIYDANGNYLIGGEIVSKFINDFIKIT